MSNVRRLTHCSRKHLRTKHALRQPSPQEAPLPVAVARTRSHIEHYARHRSTRLPDQTVAESERWPKRGKTQCTGRSVRAVRPASLAASARWWQIENTECHCLSRSSSGTLRAGSKRVASMQARDQVIREQAHSSVLRTLPSLQREKCSLSSSSRLTLPSRGHLPGFALQLPLMSNVSALNST